MYLYLHSRVLILSHPTEIFNNLSLGPPESRDSYREWSPSDHSTHKLSPKPVNTLRFAPAFPTPPSYKERVTSSCASTKTSQSPSSHILNPSSASSSRNLKFYWFSLFLLRLHLLPMVTTASLRPNHSQCWPREWCPQRCAGQDGHTAQPCLSISSMPFYLQLSEGRNEGEKEGGREGRKKRKKVQQSIQAALCASRSPFPLIFFLLLALATPLKPRSLGLWMTFLLLMDSCSPLFSESLPIYL